MCANHAHYLMRQIVPRKDLHSIADLIELCFQDTMDSDGREYLQHLRQVADDENLSAWFQSSFHPPYPRVDGFVWEEDGKIIGNLTLIPAHRDGKRVFLIANVAVHPDHRGKGIGRKLTERGLLAIRERHGVEAWLHVRADNPVAHGLYLSLGFTEKARRTTWVWEHEAVPIDEEPSQLTFGRRRGSTWQQQREWLHQFYPENVRWNLPYREELFIPGVWQSFSRIINGDVIEHWEVRRADQLYGIITWQPTRHHYDLIWLSLNPEEEKQILSRIIRLTQKLPIPRKALSINFPSGKGAREFEACGYTSQSDLIWMQADCT